MENFEIFIEILIKHFFKFFDANWYEKNDIRINHHYLFCATREILKLW